MTTTAPTTDETTFLRRICENPADDAPRLIFADWLEERAGDVECERCKGSGAVFEPKRAFAYKSMASYICGNCNGTGRISNHFAERTQFIRVQVELAKGPQCKTTVGHPKDYICDRAELWDCKRCLYMTRERELLGNHGRTLLSHTTIDQNRMKWEWSRGFISSITLTTADFLANVEKLFAMPLEKVTLSDKQPRSGQLGPPLYWWHEGDDDENYLPKEIYKTHLPSTCYIHNFDSEQAALDALSLACVNYGRHAVGLEPLEKL